MEKLFEKWREENRKKGNAPEQIEFRSNVLEAILVSSMNEDENYFPSFKEYILSELVNATIEYAGGKPGMMSYVSFMNSDNVNMFERKITEYLNSELMHTKNICSTIKSAILRMTRMDRVEVSGPDHDYLDCELYIDVQHSLFGSFHSRDSLPYSLVRKVEKQMSKFNEEEKRDINGIAKAMRKYIEDDLKYVKAHYYY